MAPLKYLSVCSGIEAATVAWHPLGWRPVAFSEIEKFPSAVLAHHYPAVPNWGDMTKFKDWPDAAVDVLVGGTPCQSFSVAGLRKGLDDPRGNLALVYLGLADRYRPEWLVWENVPGVLSSNGGRDFGAFLGGLGQLGYGFAYRVLDAQFVRTCRFPRAVPQRRRRVFVVGYLGDWRRAAAVLFDPESLRGNPPPRREAGQRPAARPAQGVALRGRDGGATAELTGEVMTALRCGGGGGDKPHALIASTGDVAHCLNAGGMGRQDYETETMIAHTLKGEGFDASEDGTGRGTPLVPVAFDCLAGGNTGLSIGEVPGTLHGGGKSGGRLAVAFDCKGSQVQHDETGASPTLRAMGHAASHPNAGGQLAVATSWAVRRLTPRECERLQGFPDDYTLIPYRRGMSADGPRYKALGNSMAVNVMEWIGQRIEIIRGLK